MFIAESLAWSEASGFYYTIHVGPSLDIQLLLCGGDPAALGLQGWSLHVFPQSIDGVDVEVGQLITLDLGLGGCRVLSARQLFPVFTTSVSSPAWRAQSRAGSPAFSSLGAALPHLRPAWATQLSYPEGLYPKCCTWWGPDIALLLLQPQSQLSHLPTGSESRG